MPISSLVIECAVGRAQEVASYLETLPGAEVHDAHDNCLVVVTDTKTKQEDRDLVDEMGSVSGVITATPVFTNCEDLGLEHLPDVTSVAAMEV